MRLASLKMVSSWSRNNARGRTQKVGNQLHVFAFIKAWYDVADNDADLKKLSAIGSDPKKLRVRFSSACSAQFHEYSREIFDVTA